uniref:Bm8907 n=1 Tax=Brugia malayi TaxID=6279 RepID=A0A0H5S434_BRUMA|nr:Bm8907 [Brugia malayi]
MINEIKLIPTVTNLLNSSNFQYLTEVSEDKRTHRVKRQCGCCSCYGSGTSCACPSSCPCAPGASSNYATGYNNIGYGSNGINFNAGYGSYGFGYNSGYPYSIYGQYNPYSYGTNYNMGTGCGLTGTGLSTGCGTTNIFPYNFGNSYGNSFGTSNTGYYPQMTGCSTAFNTRCYCGTGYSPCNNGALCCKNSNNGLMIR